MSDLEQIIPNKPFYPMLITGLFDTHDRYPRPWLVTWRKRFQNLLIGLASFAIGSNAIILLASPYFGVNNNFKKLFFYMFTLAHIVLCSLVIHFIISSKYFQNPQQPLWFAAQNVEDVNVAEINQYLDFRANLFIYAIVIVITQVLSAGMFASMTDIENSDNGATGISMFVEIGALGFSALLCYFAGESETTLRTDLPPGI